MPVRYAFVTLLTSDAYLPGALTIAASLKDVHSLLPSDQTVEYETVCLVTPETVDVTSIRLLRKAFNVVIGVEVIVPPDTEPLAVLGRPDLDTALTKLHVFRLTQYAKVIFLDADVLPLRPLSHLFHLDHEFSASPDVGWPDAFNSGVMVLSPGENKFEELQELLNTTGTWDGADQGLLNEWRGGNWNRLSFTYNTTPTAIYTYAPAYQRFGSQISVVHFIGPHKPWHSIPCCTQGSSTQSTDMDVEPFTETPATQQLAYDYDSLVDRWCSVYDRHYRLQATEPVFQPTRYTSVWNEESPDHSTVASRPLGLEELRRAALEGTETSRILAPRAHGEGEYRTMPLEGRFDLIRPRTRAERKQIEIPTDEAETSESASVPSELPTTSPEPSTPPEQILSLPSSSPVRWTTLPTPGVNEVPPAPHARLISLPPTPFRYVPTSHKPHSNTREAGAQTTPIQSQQQKSGGEDSSLTPLMWGSAVETPPNVVTPAPTDTYFPKAWDVDRNWSSTSLSSSETSLTTMEPSPPKPQPTSNVFFSSPPMPATSEVLRRQREHRNMIREGSGSPAPDLMKVKRVFPWEERPRHASGRVFPDEASPALPHLPVSATPERRVAFHSPMPSPLVDFPPSLQSHYLPDGTPSRRHTGKIPLSVLSSGPLGRLNELGRADTSSQDGDVEDEVDSEEETMMRSRARSSSIGTVKRTPRYRSIGVQTDPREVREEAIQVTTFVPVAEVAEKLGLMNKRSRRSWLTPTGTATRPTVAATRVPISLSPPTPDSHHLPLPSNPRDHRAPTALVTDETGDQSSSSAPSLPGMSSMAPPSPTGGPAPYVRKGSRVWDPARGVETFKRGSEDVLTKFMKIGSREERA